ncbi:MAG: outer membrane lipoprotein carrier protein LolA, partial [Alphaproteobacteria bacterium]|nr:outer membrane lipoprotein carrier protein LolA [Alphaproteobacteria bacterium]
MRRLSVLAAFSLALSSTSACAHWFNDADKADLDRISASLNTIRTMKGGFIQIGPDGQVDEGEFDLMKPGRIRFQYDPPTPTLIVSDGKTVAVENT